MNKHEKLRKDMTELGIIDFTWHVDDVMEDYPFCTEGEARKVLYYALSHPSTLAHVFNLIKEKCKEEGQFTQEELDGHMDSMMNRTYYGRSYG